MEAKIETTRQELEHELDTVLYPGTEIMADVGSHHFVRSSSHPDQVLVPQPSNDPNDPLNWTKQWKFTVMTIAIANCFSQGLGPLALAPMFPHMMASFNTDLAAVVNFTGVCILVLGFSNFFWIPMQATFGRRPVLILSTLVCVVSNVWRATATSYRSQIGACVLNGFGAGPSETSAPEIIADVLFLHERGAYNTLYFTAYFASLMVGPIIAGPMADKVGWRNFFWFNTALLGAVLIVTIFFFPETKWSRRETVQGVPQQVPDSKVESTYHEHVLEGGDTMSSAPPVGRGTPSKQQFRLWQVTDHSLKTLWTSFWIPWKLLAFAAPPYNFSSQTIGFLNFATLIGALIGLLTNGPLSDWVSMRATIKNRGIREPEMRLLAMIPYLLVCVLGNFIIAYGYEYKWDWKIIVIVGYTAVGIQVAALPAIISTYAVDSYKPVAGSIFVSITINKNLWGYGFSEFITDWVDQSGFVTPIMVNMSLTVLWCLCAVPFYFYGKQFRKWTANSSVHAM
ncbi:major facilitator superfamily domain-containing protein [Aspergillus insuetus]